MTNKVLLSLATVALFAATAQAYEVVSTNAWFTADGSADTKWTQPNSGITNWVGSTVLIDTTATDPLIYTPTAASATADGYRVKANVKFTRCESAPTDVPSYSESAALGALAVTPDNWYGVDGDKWVPLYGLDVPVNDETSYNVTIDFKTNGVQNLVRYTVGTTVLKNSSDTAWLTRGRNAGVAMVGLSGYGEMASLSGDTVSYFEITANTDELAAAGITGEVTEAVLNENGANGMPRWQSLVLGLTANDSSSKPFVAPVQTADSDKIGFTIGNVTSASKFGATVKFDVIELATPTATTGEVKASNVDAGTTASFEPSAGVKYYKIKIKITK